VWIPDLKFFSKDKLEMVTNEKRHLKQEYVAGLHIVTLHEIFGPNDVIVF
jgi:hypothetical protein